MESTQGNLAVINETKPAIKVSVCVPTFQHENFIRQTLDAALAQETDFPFEIVVGDDGSSDKTPEIIRQYAAQHPDKLVPYLHPKNLGPSYPPEFAGRNNVLLLLKACRGEYVALCEGDDYWTDPHKLQKQVDFMDANPSYSLCHHNLQVIYEDGSPGHLFNPPDQKDTSTIVDILEDRWFIGTASLLYRNYFLTEDFVDWHHKAASGDWALVLQIAARGPIHYFPEIMAVYRKHRGGLSNVHADTNLFFLQNRKEMFENVNNWLEKKYDQTLSKTIRNYADKLVSFSKIENS